MPIRARQHSTSCTANGWCSSTAWGASAGTTTPTIAIACSATRAPSPQGGAGDRRLALWTFPVWAYVFGDRRRRILVALPIACIEEGHGVSHHRDVHRLH